jgi:dihydrofolate reductase
MRKIVFQMMATLNGRLNQPYEWLHSVCEGQYRRIDQIYSTYDTVLVGRVTYEEMAAYWPTALSETEGTETNRKMARRMRDYRKLVFSKRKDQALTGWQNVEHVIAADDKALRDFLSDLKEQPGGNIHLSGGASFAQSVIGLGLVDEYHLFLYPAVSSGSVWFERWPGQQGLRLLASESYENGVVWLHYAAQPRETKTQPDSFTELLT